MVVVQKNKSFLEKSGNLISSLEKLNTREQIKLWRKKYSSKLRGFNVVKALREIRSAKQ